MYPDFTIRDARRLEVKKF